MRLARRGNSIGVTLSKQRLDALGWKHGDEVIVTVVGGRVQIRRADSPYQKAVASVERCFLRYPRALKMLEK